MPRLLLLTLCFTTACLDDCLETKVVRYDGGVCATDEDCASLGQYCDIPTSLCEACTTNAQCDLEATLPTCDVATKACRACATNEDCVGAVGGALCDVDSGQCVQCFTDASCGSGTCDVTTNRCTTVAPGSLQRCEPCTSDSQCAGMSACAADMYMGNRVGFACMPLPSNTQCAQTVEALRPMIEVESVPSISGATVTVCAPNLSATCQSVLDFNTGCQFDDDCGVPGLNDGRCTTVAASADRCSFACGVVEECPTNRTCGVVGGEIETRCH